MELQTAALKAIVPNSAAEQYHAIQQRNVFGLKPPTQVEVTNSPKPLPKITLTGITTILDNKRALMKVAPLGLKPGETNKELSLILTEGQREGDVEVLQIDEKTGSVKVNNSGTVMVLTFEKDGAKLPATTQPGTPGAIAIPTALPATTNPFAPTATNPVALPNRKPRYTHPPLPGVAAATATPNAPVGGVPSPTGVTPGQTATAANGQDLTAEEQAIVMELQRQANPDNAALIPPTPLTPAANPTQPAEAMTPPPAVNPPVPGRILVPQ